MRIVIDIVIWGCFLAGGVLIVAGIAVAGIVAWFWAVDGWKKLQDRLRKQRVPGLPRDGSPLSQCMRERLDQIENGYGDAPKALLRRLR